MLLVFWICKNGVKRRQSAALSGTFEQQMLEYLLEVSTTNGRQDSVESAS